MRNILLPKIENVVEQAGLELKYIDIPELILKNIVNRHPQQLKGCVFLQLNEMGGRLILCRNEQVCITRSFEIKLNNLGKDPEADNRVLETLALEVQRSFDYINSIFRQNVPNVIIIAPTTLDKSILEASLKNTLGSEVYFLKLNEHFIFEPPVKEEEEANILLATGAVLREEVPQKNEEKKEEKAK
jgi:MSHA biogenesis protein MshI